jgi:hypothetical protein
MKKLSLFTFFLLIALSSRIDATEQSVNSTKGSSELLYEKHMEVQCYIVSYQQLGEFFSQKSGSITQLPTKELLPYDMDVCFLIRIKNTGPMEVSGMLHCFVPCCGYPFPVKVMKMPSHMEDYYDFVIQFDSGLIAREGVFPKITYKWDSLKIYPQAQEKKKI